MPLVLALSAVQCWFVVAVLGAALISDLASRPNRALRAQAVPDGYGAPHGRGARWRPASGWRLRVGVALRGSAALVFDAYSCIVYDGGRDETRERELQLVIECSVVPGGKYSCRDMWTWSWQDREQRGDTSGHNRGEDRVDDYG